MMLQIRFNLLGGCFACRCFCSSASFCNFICSGIHFRAVGLEIFKAFAHCEMFPVGFSLYHASTRACKVGAPFLLMFGLSLVNLAILFTSCAVLRLRFSHYNMPVLKSPVNFQLFYMINNRKFLTVFQKCLLGGIILPWRPQNPRKIENLELKRQFLWLLHRRCLINSKKADSGNPWAGFCGLSALRPVVVGYG